MQLKQEIFSRSANLQYKDYFKKMLQIIFLLSFFTTSTLIGGTKGTNRQWLMRDRNYDIKDGVNTTTEVSSSLINASSHHFQTTRDPNNDAQGKDEYILLEDMEGLINENTILNGEYPISTDDEQNILDYEYFNEDSSTNKNNMTSGTANETNDIIYTWVEDVVYDEEEILLLRNGPIECGRGEVSCGKRMAAKKHARMRHMKVPSILWPYGRLTGFPLVPYRILIKGDPDLVSLIEESIWEWGSASCIDFVEVSEENEAKLGTEEYLNIVRHPVRCLFRFGKERGRSQTLFLHPSCHTKEEIVRALGIALGIHYQFLRKDRDFHVTINHESTNENFPAYGTDKNLDTQVPYDYSSVMQPHGVWYSKDGRIIFSTKDIKYQGILGRSGGSISHRDRLVVNHFYGCLARWRSSCGLRSNPCENEGYVGPRCLCVCRPGTFGSNCQNVENRDYYEHLLPKCSRDIREETTIQIPFYEDGFVPHGTWCVWSIHAAEGQLVKLNFTYFNLEKSGHHCEEAFLEIREKDEDFGHMYCGSELNQVQEIISTTNELHLYLDVRNNISQGFRAEIIFTGRTLFTGGTVFTGTTATQVIPTQPMLVAADEPVLRSLAHGLHMNVALVAIVLMISSFSSGLCLSE